MLALWIRPSGLTNPIPSYSYFRYPSLCFLLLPDHTFHGGEVPFFFITKSPIEPYDYRVVFFIQKISPAMPGIFFEYFCYSCAYTFAPEVRSQRSSTSAAASISVTEASRNTAPLMRSIRK